MMTMYEKEALFESLDDTFSEIKAYLIGAIDREELHEVEHHLFRQISAWVVVFWRPLLLCRARDMKLAIQC